MFAIQWGYALANISLCLIIYIYIGQANPGVFPGKNTFFFFFIYGRSLETWLRVPYSKIYTGPLNINVPICQILKHSLFDVLGKYIAYNYSFNLKYVFVEGVILKRQWLRWYSAVLNNLFAGIADFSLWQWVRDGFRSCCRWVRSTELVLFPCSAKNEAMVYQSSVENFV